MPSLWGVDQTKTMIIVKYLSRTIKGYKELFHNVPPKMDDFSPCCQAKLYHHGHYKRTVVTKKDVDELKIYRFLCSECDKTFSLLPDFLSPYQVFYSGIQEGVFYRRLIIKKSSAVVHRGLVSEETGGISERTLKRWIGNWRKKLENVIQRLSNFILELDPFSRPHVIIQNHDPCMAAFILTKALWKNVHDQSPYPFSGFFRWLNVLFHP